MEWSPPSDDPRQALHQVLRLQQEGNRIFDPVLDDHGIKLQPGVCLACHGGNVTDKTYQAGCGDVGAHFIPFDLDGLTYSTTKGFRREDQEAAFKKFNRAVLQTWPADDPVYAAIRRPTAN